MTLGELLSWVSHVADDLGKVIPNPLEAEVFINIVDGENHPISYLSWDNDGTDDSKVCVWINSVPMMED